MCLAMQRVPRICFSLAFPLCENVLEGSAQDGRPCILVYTVIQILTRSLSQGGGWGLYGLLSAPVSTWDAMTEAEIGQDWVQFLLDEADKGASVSVKEGTDLAAVTVAIPSAPGNAGNTLPTLTPSH